MYTMNIIFHEFQKIVQLDEEVGIFWRGSMYILGILQFKKIYFLQYTTTNVKANKNWLPGASWSIQLG